MSWCSCYKVVRCPALFFAHLLNHSNKSDAPDEVVVVKQALMEHLDLDPKVTLTVLCDQIAPPEETVGEEEQAIRDRLRSLVLSFLTGEARRAIVGRHALPGSGAEETLLSYLFAVRHPPYLFPLL